MSVSLVSIVTIIILVSLGLTVILASYFSISSVGLVFTNILKLNTLVLSSVDFRPKWTKALLPILTDMFPLPSSTFSKTYGFFVGGVVGISVDDVGVGVSVDVGVGVSVDDVVGVSVVDVVGVSVVGVSVVIDDVVGVSVVDDVVGVSVVVDDVGGVSVVVVDDVVGVSVVVDDVVGISVDIVGGSVDGIVGLLVDDFLV